MICDGECVLGFHRVNIVGNRCVVILTFISLYYVINVPHVLRWEYADEIACVAKLFYFVESRKRTYHCV